MRAGRDDGHAEKAARFAVALDLDQRRQTVSDDADVMEYVRAVTNIAGSEKIDRVVGLDEFDVLTAAMTREHLNMPGMTRSFALRFRDKFTMRNVARWPGSRARSLPAFLTPTNQRISSYGPGSVGDQAAARGIGIWHP